MATSYKKRYDGRKMDELRPIEAEVGIIKRANGSARFKIGNTEALAAVYGPRELNPRFMQNPRKGILRVHYNMMPFYSDLSMTIFVPVSFSRNALILSVSPVVCASFSTFLIASTANTSIL